MSKINLRNHPKESGVYISGPSDNMKLYTKNLEPGKNVFNQKLVKLDDVQYREWDPYRSKMAAILLNNPETTFFNPKQKILYLGASSGTTVSHFSDIIEEGIIYAVEFAEKSMRQLIQNTKNRTNIIPILGDARYPFQFSNSIFSQVDMIYQDVAQPNQAEIAISNGDYYLEKNGLISIAIKSQSIDSTMKPQKVFELEQRKLEKGGYKVIEKINIQRYAAEHIVFIAKKEN